MLNIEHTDIEGLLLIKPNIYKDERGSYTEIYDTETYRDILPIGTNFVQDDYSYSKINVLRGIHGDFITSKLISVLNGMIQAVIVDNRKESNTYMKWQSFILSRENANQLFIPAGCGNSMLALTDDVVYHYKQTSHYTPKSQFTIKWDDPRLNIKWLILNPILSNRDRKGDY